MKNSIRNPRFTIGMVLFLVIILLLSVSSAFYLNRLSGKTSAILKENHYSVIYARDMSEALTNINLVIINSFLKNIDPDTSVIKNGFVLFNKSLELEKSNITEIGEDKLAYDIDTCFKKYHDSIIDYVKSTGKEINVLSLQGKFDTLFNKLMQLSQMNEEAIQAKTDDAKVSAQKFAFQMTIIGTICFLIAYGFTFILSSYFSERFYILLNGIKGISSSNYSQKLFIEGNDELTEIAKAFNEMADKLNKNKV
jgi:two-component system, NtrC family, sensor histidine kinase KinB